MKTAISIPDPIFHAAEGLAHRLGIPRSQLYSQAVAEYMESHRNHHVTETINAIYEQEASTLDSALSTMQSQSIPKDGWE